MTTDPQLQLIADRFAKNWQQDHSPELREFRDQVPGNRRLELLKLLIPIDIQFRLVNGLNPTSLDYLEFGPEGISIAEQCLTENADFYSRPDVESTIGSFSQLDADENTELPRTSQHQASANENTKSPRESSQDSYIGNYHLIKLLGVGGMGEVWMAEQVRPVKRKVALKLIKSGVGSKEIIARFDAERQALAMMNHPNIARILDAGTTPAGQPYFVMELVSGKPLTTYCDEQRLSINDRLTLFADVCAGVQHAHQKGIIHRDLKPTNIMVDVQDGVAAPKIIDFGLAKAMKSVERLTDQSLFTGIGQILGTLKYMSPEQASIDNIDIDTRTDVYALGVILYELLTGATPLDEDSIKGAAVLKILEFIRDKEPIKPSSRLGSRTSEQVSTITGQRKTDSVRLNRILAGDLDWIVMKALEKDRTRRYESAAGFADDITRYLNSEPVNARPPSVNYRVRKFVRKNRVGVVAASLVLLALVGGIVGTTWGLLRAESERFKVDIARKDAEEKSRIAVSEKRNADRQRLRAEGQEKIATAAQSRAEDALFQVSRTAYQPLLNSALTSFLAGNYDHAEQKFSKLDPQFRGWEWNYVDLLIRGGKVKFKPSTFLEMCQLTPDGSFLVTADLLTSSLTVFDANNGQVIRNILVHPNREGQVSPVSPICSWAIDPTGEWIVTAARFFPEIALSNLRTGKVVDIVPLAIENSTQVFEPEIEIAKDFKSGTVSIQEKTFSFKINSNRKIDVAPEVKTNPGVFYNKLTKKTLTIEKVPKEIQAKCTVCFCPESDFALCSDGQTNYYLVDSGDPGSVRKLNIPATHRQPTTAAISPDRREMAIGFNDQTILIWDVENDRLLTKLKTHDAAPKHLEYTSDGNKLLTSEHNVAFLQTTSWRSQTYLASLSTKSPIIKIVGVTNKEIADEFILIETKDHEIWKVPLLVSNEVRRLDVSKFSRFAISADGRFVGGYDSEEKEIQVFSLDDLVTPVAKIKSGEFTEKKQIQTPWLKTGEARIHVVKPGQKFSYPEKLVGGFDFDMAQKRCAICKQGNGLLSVIDFDGTQISESHPMRGTDYGPKMSPNQKLVAIQQRGLSLVVDMEIGKAYASTAPVIAFTNHASKWLSCYERTAKIFDFGGFHDQAIDLTGHSDNVTHGIFTTDDKRVFTGSADGTVRIWDVLTGEELLILHQFSEPVGGICLVNDGETLVAVSESGDLRVFEGGEATSLEKRRQALIESRLKSSTSMDDKRPQADATVKSSAKSNTIVIGGAERTNKIPPKLNSPFLPKDDTAPRKDAFDGELKLFHVFDSDNFNPESVKIAPELMKVEDGLFKVRFDEPKPNAHYRARFGTPAKNFAFSTRVRRQSGELIVGFNGHGTPSRFRWLSLMISQNGAWILQNANSELVNGQWHGRDHDKRFESFRNPSLGTNEWIKISGRVIDDYYQLWINDELVAEEFTPAYGDPALFGLEIANQAAGGLPVECDVDYIAIWDATAKEPSQEIPGTKEERLPNTDKSERTIAQWAQTLGGGVNVNQDWQWLDAQAQLPNQHFTVSQIWLANCKGLSDENFVSLNQCKQLRSLVLDGTSISNLGLEKLDLNNQMESIELRGTKVSIGGLKNIEHLSGLRYLGLGRTGIQDDDLLSIARLKNLRELNLTSTIVSDRGIEHLQDLTKLRTLDLAFLPITDVGLATIGRLPTLTSLVLTGTNISDMGLSNMRRLKNLRELHLARTSITDNGFAELPALKFVSVLYLNQTLISNESLKQLADSRFLTTLDISGSNCDGAGLVNLEKCRGLRTLSLGGLKVDDSHLKQLVGFSYLENLNLNNTKITDGAVDEFVKLTSLRTLNLEGCSLSDKQVNKLKAHLPNCNVRWESTVSNEMSK